MKTKKKFIDKTLLGWEIKKLCEMPMLFLFIILCILFNVILTASDQYGADYVSYVKEVRDAAGSRMGAEFDQRLLKLPDEDEHKSILIEETKGAKDLFEEYDALMTARRYLGAYHMTGWVADVMEWKYQKQNQQVHRLAKQDVSMDVGAAGMTKPVLDSLFQKLCKAVITESWLLGILTALYICGSEKISRTWQTVYASRRGRAIQKEKFAAGILYTLGAYAVTALISCAVFEAVWHLGDIWNTNMSTQFYYIEVIGWKLPFVPWVSFTVCEYLGATLGMGAVTVTVFYGLGYVAGLLTKNSFAGFLLIFVVLALNFEIGIMAGNNADWGLYEAAMWSPVMLWWMQPLWFSDMGISALLPWQECITAAGCLIGTVMLLVLGFRYFYRRDFA